MLNGWLCLDKPDGMSSNFAMIKVRRILGEKSTGYIGTLDPFATGVLPLAIGQAKKFIRFVEESDKRYLFTVVFGTQTDTLDLTGKIISQSNVIPSTQQLHEIVKEFIGKTQQIPPIYSAIKFNGIRACDLARKGHKPIIKPKEIEIFDLSIIEDLTNSEISFDVTCSKGTYVRSIARDIAAKAGTVCYVKELKRVKSGFFSIDQSITIDFLEKIKDTGDMVNFLLKTESPLDDIPAICLSLDDVTRLQNGLCVLTQNSAASQVRVLCKDSMKFCGIAEVDCNGVLRVIRMCAK